MKTLETMVYPLIVFFFGFVLGRRLDPATRATNARHCVACTRPYGTADVRRERERERKRSAHGFYCFYKAIQELQNDI
jgi:hypothetical protein